MIADRTLPEFAGRSWGGMSGSGVYRWWSGVRYVFAVHTGDDWFWSVHYNTSTRINEARFNLILAWMATGV